MTLTIFFSCISWSCQPKEEVPPCPVAPPRPKTFFPAPRPTTAQKPQTKKPKKKASNLVKMAYRDTVLVCFSVPGLSNMTAAAGMPDSMSFAPRLRKGVHPFIPILHIPLTSVHSDTQALILAQLKQSPDADSSDVALPTVESPHPSEPVSGTATASVDCETLVANLPSVPQQPPQQHFPHVPLSAVVPLHDLPLPPARLASLPDSAEATHELHSLSQLRRADCAEVDDPQFRLTALEAKPKDRPGPTATLTVNMIDYEPYANVDSDEEQPDDSDEELELQEQYAPVRVSMVS
jgi:hypothetical protein